MSEFLRPQPLLAHHIDLVVQNIKNNISPEEVRSDMAWMDYKEDTVVAVLETIDFFRQHPEHPIMVLPPGACERDPLCKICQRLPKPHLCLNDISAEDGRSLHDLCIKPKNIVTINDFL